MKDFDLKFVLAMSAVAGYVAVSLFDTHGKDVTNVLVTLQNLVIMAFSYYFHASLSGSANGSGSNGNVSH